MPRRSQEPCAEPEGEDGQFDDEEFVGNDNRNLQRGHHNENPTTTGAASGSQATSRSQHPPTPEKPMLTLGAMSDDSDSEDDEERSGNGTSSLSSTIGDPRSRQRQNREQRRSSRNTRRSRRHEDGQQVARTRSRGDKRAEWQVLHEQEAARLAKEAQKAFHKTACKVFQALMLASCLVLLSVLAYHQYLQLRQQAAHGENSLPGSGSAVFPVGKGRSGAREQARSIVLDDRSDVGSDTDDPQERGVQNSKREKIRLSRKFEERSRGFSTDHVTRRASSSSTGSSRLPPDRHSGRNSRSKGGATRRHSSPGTGRRPSRRSGRGSANWKRGASDGAAGTTTVALVNGTIAGASGTRPPLDDGAASSTDGGCNSADDYSSTEEDDDTTDSDVDSAFAGAQNEDASDLELNTTATSRRTSNRGNCNMYANKNKRPRRTSKKYVHSKTKNSVVHNYFTIQHMSDEAGRYFFGNAARAAGFGGGGGSAGAQSSSQAAPNFQYTQQPGSSTGRKNADEHDRSATPGDGGVDAGVPTRTPSSGAQQHDSSSVVSSSVGGNSEDVLARRNQQELSGVQNMRASTPGGATPSQSEVVESGSGNGETFFSAASSSIGGDDQSGSGRGSPALEDQISDTSDARNKKKRAQQLEKQLQLALQLGDTSNQPARTSATLLPLADYVPGNGSNEVVMPAPGTHNFTHSGAIVPVVVAQQTAESLGSSSAAPALRSGQLALEDAPPAAPPSPVGVLDSANPPQPPASPVGILDTSGGSASSQRPNAGSLQHSAHLFSSIPPQPSAPLPLVDPAEVPVPLSRPGEVDADLVETSDAAADKEPADTSNTNKADLSREAARGPEDGTSSTGLEEVPSATPLLDQAAPSEGEGTSSSTSGSPAQSGNDSPSGSPAVPQEEENPEARRQVDTLRREIPVMLASLKTYANLVIRLHDGRNRGGANPNGKKPKKHSAYPARLAKKALSAFLPTQGNLPTPEEVLDRLIDFFGVDGSANTSFERKMNAASSAMDGTNATSSAQPGGESNNGQEDVGPGTAPKEDSKKRPSASLTPIPSAAPALIEYLNARKTLVQVTMQKLWLFVSGRVGHFKLDLRADYELQKVPPSGTTTGGGAANQGQLVPTTSSQSGASSGTSTPTSARKHSLPMFLFGEQPEEAIPPTVYQHNVKYECDFLGVKPHVVGAREHAGLVHVVSMNSSGDSDENSTHDNKQHAEMKLDTGANELARGKTNELRFAPILERSHESQERSGDWLRNSKESGDQPLDISGILSKIMAEHETTTVASGTADADGPASASPNEGGRNKRNAPFSTKQEAASQDEATSKSDRPGTRGDGAGGENKDAFGRSPSVGSDLYIPTGGENCMPSIPGTPRSGSDIDANIEDMHRKPFAFGGGRSSGSSEVRRRKSNSVDPSPASNRNRGRGGDQTISMAMVQLPVTTYGHNEVNKKPSSRPTSSTGGAGSARSRAAGTGATHHHPARQLVSAPTVMPRPNNWSLLSATEADRALQSIPHLPFVRGSGNAEQTTQLLSPKENNSFAPPPATSLQQPTTSSSSSSAPRKERQIPCDDGACFPALRRRGTAAKKAQLHDIGGLLNRENRLMRTSMESDSALVGRGSIVPASPAGPHNTPSNSAGSDPEGSAFLSDVTISMPMVIKSSAAQNKLPETNATTNGTDTRLQNVSDDAQQQLQLSQISSNGASAKALGYGLLPSQSGDGSGPAPYSQLNDESGGSLHGIPFPEDDGSDTAFAARRMLPNESEFFDGTPEDELVDMVTGDTGEENPLVLPPRRSSLVASPSKDRKASAGDNMLGKTEVEAGEQQRFLDVDQGPDTGNAAAPQLRAATGAEMIKLAARGEAPPAQVVMEDSTTTPRSSAASPKGIFRNSTDHDETDVGQKQDTPGSSSTGPASAFAPQQEAMPPPLWAGSAASKVRSGHRLDQNTYCVTGDASPDQSREELRVPNKAPSPEKIPFVGASSINNFNPPEVLSKTRSKKRSTGVDIEQLAKIDFSAANSAILGTSPEQISFWKTLLLEDPQEWDSLPAVSKPGLKQSQLYDRLLYQCHQKETERFFRMEPKKQETGAAGILNALFQVGGAGAHRKPGSERTCTMVDARGLPKPLKNWVPLNEQYDASFTVPIGHDQAILEPSGLGHDHQYKTKWNMQIERNPLTGGSPRVVVKRESVSETGDRKEKAYTLAQPQEAARLAQKLSILLNNEYRNLQGM
ncbi:unnamed protein product [Amoebophrya sp. A120]|nr:unnamed protein product [Amoebophrya sp. A120]|eukprot:GSA120T00004874001.1